MEATCLKGAYDAASLTGNIHVDRLPASAKCQGTSTVDGFSQAGAASDFVCPRGSNTNYCALIICATGTNSCVKAATICGNSFRGEGSNITDLDGSEIKSGTIGTAYLPAAALCTGTVNDVGSTADDILGISSGSICALDAGSDKIVFWDDNVGALKYLTAGNNLSISGTTLSSAFRTVTAGGNTLGSAESLDFVAGTNISITESGGDVTINSTGGGATSVCGSWTTPSNTGHDFCVAPSRCISGPVICGTTCVYGAKVCGAHYGDGSNLTSTATVCTSAADVLAATNYGAISAVDATKDKLIFWDESAGKLKYLAFSCLEDLP
jgi:hypothetical protein